jgi:geranylgeranyl pyrophosphate synthase
VNSLATVKATPGLATYLAELETRLEAVVAAYPGRVGSVGGEALAAGGKRLRPLLVFLSAGGEQAPLSAGIAVELVHLATLVHDDLVDGARVRRGQPAAWAVHGETAALATGDYLFARAFAELTATGEAEAVLALAEASRCLARGEALQRSHQHRPDTAIEAVIERYRLKTAKLFEVACLLGAGRRDHRLAAYGEALGVAFQIADDILDCAGETLETGKVAGTDLREGTPTVPLLLAAQVDPEVRDALAGGSLDGALARVAETGALDRSRELALDYARKARECLVGEARRDELEALTYAVVERTH